MCLLGAGCQQSSEGGTAAAGEKNIGGGPPRTKVKKFQVAVMARCRKQLQK